MYNFAGIETLEIAQSSRFFNRKSSVEAYLTVLTETDRIIFNKKMSNTGENTFDNASKLIENSLGFGK